MRNRRDWIKLAVVSTTAAWLGVLAFAAPAMPQEKVTVFAAASLKNALDAANTEWRKESARETTVHALLVRYGEPLEDDELETRKSGSLLAHGLA